METKEKRITSPVYLGKNLSSTFFIIGALFLTCLLLSNIIASKLVTFMYWVIPAGTVIFPITYIFGDILTEVYGFKRARLVIWTGLVMNLFMVLVFYLVVILPFPPFWANQEAYKLILWSTPRLVGASLVAYLFGEFINSIILSRIKIATNGRFLWIRTISSTIVGEGFDSTIFIVLAFGWTMPWPVVWSMVLVQWIIKSLYEIAATPLTYLIVHQIKKKENVDVFDVGIKYNPFGRG